MISDVYEAITGRIRDGHVTVKNDVPVMTVTGT